MYVAVTVVHIVACIFLIGVVLLQQGKGADMGAVFGGSSQTVFGSSGAGNFLTRLTTGMAVVFMITSLTLAYGSARRVTSTVFDDAPLPESAPLEAPVAPAPEAEAPAAQPAPQAAAPAQGSAPVAENAVEGSGATIVGVGNAETAVGQGAEAAGEAAAVVEDKAEEAAAGVAGEAPKPADPVAPAAP
jgi:preprotein translocase subunit SecG